MLQTLLSRPETAWVLVAVVAILGVGGKTILEQIHRHRERMAKIGQGIDPDRVEDAPHERGG